jgi:hypothetical protein
MGFEPTSDFDATGNLRCGCVICERCRAANALHIDSTNLLDLASSDADLQRIAAAWDRLAKAAKAAIVALLEV